MTPKSKSLARVYVDEVINQKDAFIENLIEPNIVTKVEKEDYVVPKFKMTAAKLVGDLIICDDYL